jgi:hypothetical protein
MGLKREVQRGGAAYRPVGRNTNPPETCWLGLRRTGSAGRRCRCDATNTYLCFSRPPRVVPQAWPDEVDGWV